MAEQEKAGAKPATVAKLLTWLGDDDDHYQMVENENNEVERMDVAGPSFMYWARVRFDKDKPVLIDPAQAPTPDLKLTFEHFLKKAPHMARFKVEDVDEAAAEEGGEVGEPKRGTHHAKPHIQPVPKRRR